VYVVALGDKASPALSGAPALKTRQLGTNQFALSEYSCALDELNEVSSPPEDQDMSVLGCSLRRRRSSAASGMGVLALE
jgi:hypothetical protein